MHDFAQFHIWFSPQMTVREAHRVMDEIETRLHRAFPGVEILIHPDPEGHVDSQSDPMRSKDAAVLIEQDQEAEQREWLYVGERMETVIRTHSTSLRVKKLN